MADFITGNEVYCAVAFIAVLTMWIIYLQIRVYSAHFHIDNIYKKIAGIEQNITDLTNKISILTRDVSDVESKYDNVKCDVECIIEDIRDKEVEIVKNKCIEIIKNENSNAAHYENNGFVGNAYVENGLIIVEVREEDFDDDYEIFTVSRGN